LRVDRDAVFFAGLRDELFRAPPIVGGFARQQDVLEFPAEQLLHRGNVEAVRRLDERIGGLLRFVERLDHGRRRATDGAFCLRARSERRRRREQHERNGDWFHDHVLTGIVVPTPRYRRRPPPPPPRLAPPPPPPREPPLNPPPPREPLLKPPPPRDPDPKLDEPRELLARAPAPSN